MLAKPYFQLKPSFSSKREKLEVHLVEQEDRICKITAKLLVQQ